MLLLLFLACQLATALDVRNHRIDTGRVEEYVNEVMAQSCLDIPGMTVGFVLVDEEKNVLQRYAKGFGRIDPTCNWRDCVKVNNQTLFPIGSITKQFTANTLGKLLKSHPKYNETLFDTPLAEIYEKATEFFPGSAVSEMITVRDLLAHRMGIATHDIAWILGMKKSRTEAWRQISTVKPIAPARSHFRNGFLYNNLMYALAGHVIELLTGTSYEQVLKALVFDKIGMASTDFTFTATGRVRNMAKCATRNGTIWTAIDQKYGSESVFMTSPAGGIASNSVDMVKYMEMLLRNNDDVFPKQLLDDAMFQPSNYFKFSPRELYQNTHDYDLRMNNYGAGYFQGSYNGYQWVSHAGGISGFESAFHLYPGLGLGYFCSEIGSFFVLGNGNCDKIGFRLVDMLTGKDPSPLDKPQIKCGSIYDQVPTNTTAQSNTAKSTTTLLPQLDCRSEKLRKYEGEYTHPLFDPFSLTYNTVSRTLEWKYGKFGAGTVCLKTNSENRATLQLAPHLPQILTLGLPLDIEFEVTSDGQVTKLVAVFFAPQTPPKFTKVVGIAESEDEVDVRQIHRS